MIIYSNELSAPTLGAEEQRIKEIGDRVEKAEAELWLSYNRIAKLALAGGSSSFLPTKMLLGYNINRKNFIETVEAWLELRQKEGVAPDLDRSPTYPPKFLLPSSVTSEILVDKVQVSFGPEDDLRKARLGTTEAANIEKPPRPIQTIGPWAIALVLVGLAIGSATLVYAIKEWKRPEVEYNSSLAEQTLYQSKATSQVTETITKLYLDCAQTTTNPDKKKECLNAASKAVAGSLQSLPKPTQPKRAWSTFEKIGFAAVLVGGSYLAWKAYLNYQERKQLVA